MISFRLISGLRKRTLFFSFSDGARSCRKKHFQPIIAQNRQGRYYHFKVKSRNDGRTDSPSKTAGGDRKHICALEGADIPVRKDRHPAAKNFFTNFLDIMHSPLCYSLFKATKSFCLRLHELTGTQFHGIIHPEKCWNVTGRVGLTNSILYLRVGVSDGAGRFFTQNRADATLHSASGDTGADAAVAVQKAAFEAEPKWTDSGRLCTIRTIRVSPSLF